MSDEFPWMLIVQFRGYTISHYPRFRTKAAAVSFASHIWNLPRFDDQPVIGGMGLVTRSAFPPMKTWGAFDPKIA